MVFTNFKNKNTLETLINTTGLLALGLASFLYCILHRNFAELNLKLSFLDFPIFIGEVLLIFCLLFLAIKLTLNFPRFNRGHCLVLIYFLFILIKAFWGYSKWGPLAFRHAALFYYPLFFIFGYKFYQKSFFNKYTIPIIFLFLVYNTRQTTLVSLLLAVVLLIAYWRKSKLSYVLLLGLLSFTPFHLLYKSSRTAMISSFLTILFILAALLFISKLKIRYKIYLLIASFVFSLLVLFKVSPTNELKSLVSFKHLLNGYKLERQRIAEREINFGIQDIKVALYNPEVKQNGLKQTIQVKPDEPQVDLERVKPALEEIVVVSSSLKDPEAEVIQARIRELKDKVGKNEATLSKNQLNTQEGLNSLYRNAKGVVRILEDKSSILSLEDIRKIERAKTLLGELSVIIDKSQAKSKAKPITRNLDGANTSSLFRIFIWEDMIKQLIEEKPLLGFDFGKPLRSKNIEILYLAEADWKACGWITPHNSYLHAVYRAGVVGLLYVIIIYIFLLIMIKNFISLRSVKGILLSGSVMVWLIAANFFVIFELPYSAIPFWSLFGMSWAYLSGLNRKLNSQRRKM